MTNEDTTDFDEHFAKISSYIVDTLHGVPLEMTEDEKEQFRIKARFFRVERKESWLCTFELWSKPNE